MAAYELDNIKFEGISQLSMTIKQLNTPVFQFLYTSDIKGLTIK